LNFGNPEDPEVFWTFEKAVEGLADAAKVLEVPCVGGNVSFYNHDEVNNVAVKPSPVVFVAGVLEDATKAVNKKLKAADEFIFLVGETKTELGGSEYAKVAYNSENGLVPQVDLSKAKLIIQDIIKVIKEGLVTACHDISKGGFFVALTEMALAGNLGFDINLRRIVADTERSDIKLFSETPARFIITTKEENVEKIIATFARHEIPASFLGKVSSEKRLVIQDKNKQLVNLSLDEIKKVWKYRLEEEMEGKKKEQ